MKAILGPDQPTIKALLDYMENPFGPPRAYLGTLVQILNVCPI